MSWDIPASADAANNKFCHDLSIRSSFVSVLGPAGLVWKLQSSPNRLSSACQEKHPQIPAALPTSIIPPISNIYLLTNHLADGNI